MTDKEDDIIVEDVPIENIELKPDFDSDEEMVDARMLQKPKCLVCDRPAVKWMFEATPAGLSYDEETVVPLCKRHFEGMIQRLKSKREKRLLWFKTQKENK